MINFVVSFEISIDAETPQEAEKIAREAMKAPDALLDISTRDGARGLRVWHTRAGKAPLQMSGPLSELLTDWL